MCVPTILDRIPFRVEIYFAKWGDVRKFGGATKQFESTIIAINMNIIIDCMNEPECQAQMVFCTEMRAEKKQNNDTCIRQ